MSSKPLPNLLNPGGGWVRPASPITERERLGESRLAYAQRNEARLFALAIVRDKEYREALLKAARDRTLPAAVETTLLAYAYGKPTERIELGRPGAFEDLTSLSPSELAQRARALALAASELDLSPAAQLLAEREVDAVSAIAEERTEAEYVRKELALPAAFPGMLSREEEEALRERVRAAEEKE